MGKRAADCGGGEEKDCLLLPLPGKWSAWLKVHGPLSSPCLIT